MTDGFFAIGSDKNIYLGEIRDTDFWTQPRYAFNQNNIERDFIQLEIDEAGVYVLSSSWKTREISLVELKTGAHNVTFSSGDVTTSMRYAASYRFLITSSTNGCAYIWKMPFKYTKDIEFKFRQKSIKGATFGGGAPDEASLGGRVSTGQGTPHGPGERKTWDQAVKKRSEKLPAQSEMTISPAWA